MMRRGRNFLSSRTKGSDDDGDEDYVFDEEDDDNDDSDVPKGFLVSSSDDDDDEEEDHHHRLQKKKSKPPPRSRKRPLRTPSLLQNNKKKRSRSSTKRTKLSDDDYEQDYDFDLPDSDSDSDDAIVTHNKNKRKSLKNTKLLITSSQSDDDFDLLQHYTVSDQDEEQANHFIHNSLPHPRNSSLFNTRPSNYHPPRPKRRKHQTQNDTSKLVCGICFSEQAKGILRGSLNCCTHYFCFACIMEWSKVESRCPLCKQRFVAISKPARSYLGLHLRTMVIQVPKRDQVYQPSEEELRNFLDPYDGVVCMECQLGGDDCLMLLCDICDSPAHTYCVGLGREVPEGNWYCKGCRISEPGPSNAQVQDLSQGTTNSGIPTYLYGQRPNLEDTDLIPQSTVSVSESTNEIGVHLSPRHSVADDGHLASPSGLGVSTLSGRRRIHRQIRNLISSTRTSQRIEMATQTEEGNVESEAVPNAEVEQIGKPNTQHEASSGFNSFVYDFWTQDGNPSSVEKEISSPYV